MRRVPGHHVRRGEAAVFGGVPLTRNVWIEASEVIVANLHLFIGADRTAGTVDARFHLRPPFVAVRTAPPDNAVRAGQHLIRGEVAVFFRMPFLRNERIQGGEVIDT